MSISKGKARKVLSNSFVENHEDVSEDRALELIFDCETKMRDLRDDRNNDDKLNAAKAITKDLNAGYKSAIDYEKAKVQFLLEKVEEIREYEPGSGDTHE